MQNDITTAANAKKTPKAVFFYNETKSMYLIKWPKNIVAEPSHEDGQCIVFKIH